MSSLLISGTGVIVPVSSTTFTGISTSFVDPSGNVTSTVPVVLPGSSVFGFSFSSTVEPSGRLSMLSVKSTSPPLVTSSSVTSGTNVSAIDFSTSTGTSTTLDEPSSNVTFAFPV